MTVRPGTIVAVLAGVAILLFAGARLLVGRLSGSRPDPAGPVEVGAVLFAALLFVLAAALQRRR